ncbi:MAG: DNA-binding protein [Deltaproteobacteria bacterium]|nr:DNA-binding protein [Deltaproteobacteria bacterium]
MEAIPIPGFSEPISSWTHYLGAFLAVVFGVMLINRVWGSSKRRVSAYVIFALGTVFLFSMSGTYHLLEPGGTPRFVLRRLDHAAIFVLIAASFTPVIFDAFSPRSRVAILSFVWTAALCGVLLKVVWLDDIPEWIGLSLYFGLGWFGAVTGALTASKFGIRPMRPLLLGGIMHTVGALFDFAQWPILVPGVFGPHEIFHVFVLAGMAFHWSFVFRTAEAPLVPRPAWILQKRRAALLRRLRRRRGISILARVPRPVAKELDPVAR